MHYSVAFTLLLTDLSNFPNAYSRTARLLYARTTPKLWERSLACFYLFFPAERGMELAIPLLTSYVIMTCMPILSLTYAEHTFGFAWKPSRHAHAHTHTHPHTHTPTHSHTHAHNGRHPSHAVLFSQKTVRTVD